MPDFLLRLRDGLRFSHGFAGRSGSFEDWRSEDDQIKVDDAMVASRQARRVPWPEPVYDLRLRGQG